MADSDKAKEGEAAPVDAERVLLQARMALKTGISAYENENFVFAETLLIKALDLFEQANKLEDKGYFQCLHQVADTYFQLGRYFEAKSYYERLSVARLKNPDSTDAQVVVALLKLASTYEKLGEAAEALTAFDLIMELAEKTIPTGHALFGVIFDSYEDLINRQIADDDERDRRHAIIVQKREQFGFTKDTDDPRWSHAKASGGQGEGEGVLAQEPEELRKNLKAWTHADMAKPNLEQAVQRANQERLASLEGRSENPRDEYSGGMVQAHLTPDMFRRKPQGDKEEEGAEIVEKHDLSGVDPYRSFVPEVSEQPEDEESAPAEAPPANSMRRTSGGGALKGVKRPNTDRKRFNPIPAITVIACLSLVGGAIFVAHEYAKNNAMSTTTVPVLGASDYSGKSWVAADAHKMLRCLGPTACEYTASGASAAGVYSVIGQPGADKSIISDFLNGHPTKLIYEETPGGLKGADGTMLYAEEGKDRQILDKMQAIANFAQYYFASHGHLYPARADDFKFGNARFAWENPITGETNKPVVKSASHQKSDFDGSFVSAIKDLRSGKAVFDADSATGTPAGLIECMALMPVAPGGEGASAPTSNTSFADESGCAFLIRAYDAEGKMINSSDPSKAYVMVLKNGISIDPVKAVHETPSTAPPLAGKVDVEINPLPKPADNQKK